MIQLLFKIIYYSIIILIYECFGFEYTIVYLLAALNTKMLWSYDENK